MAWLTFICISILSSLIALECAVIPLNSISVNPTSYDYLAKGRPQLHFSVPYGWMNDPNGFVEKDGTYHLYYQYNPNDTKWGPMHWGHAMSKDLIHWENLPIALRPFELGTIYSGSAIVDRQNVTGFKKDSKNDPLIAIYTLDDSSYETQALAYSLDDGVTFTQYHANPVITNPSIRDFRDPNVFRYGDHFIMILAAGDHVQMYSSKNLINWKLLSDFGVNPEQGERRGIWECPSLFPLPVMDGQDRKLGTKWVMLISLNLDGDAQKRGSVTQYFIGQFNGTHFINENDPKLTLWNDYGPDNYAAIPLSEHSQPGTVLMGWMSNWVYGAFTPTDGWRGQMTLPRLALLRDVKGKAYLAQVPHPNIFMQRIHDRAFTLSEPHALLSNRTFELKQSNLNAQMFNVEMRVLLKKRPVNGTIEVMFANSLGERSSVGFDFGSNTYFFDRTHSGQPVHETFARKTEMGRILDENELEFTIFFDTISVEMFADRGLNVLSGIYYPTERYNKLSVNANYESNLINPNEANLIITELKVYPMRSIWE